MTPERLRITRRIFALAQDVLTSREFRQERFFLQHGRTSCYAHSLRVACLALEIAERLRLRVDTGSLARGALLHDLFLYDWHEKDPAHRWHGFRHPAFALRNAQARFSLNDTERDIILHHMFPLTPAPPRCREGLLVCLADKLCALEETIHRK